MIWSILSLVASANFLWFFVPPDDFFRYLSEPLEHKILLGFWIGTALFLVYDIIFLKEDWCIYVCPYSRVQSVLYDEDTLQAIYDENRVVRYMMRIKISSFLRKKSFQMVLIVQLVNTV